MTITEARPLIDSGARVETQPLTDAESAEFDEAWARLRAELDVLGDDAYRTTVILFEAALDRRVSVTEAGALLRAVLDGRWAEVAERLAELPDD